MGFFWNVFLKCVCVIEIKSCLNLTMYSLCKLAVSNGYYHSRVVLAALPLFQILMILIPGISSLNFTTGTIGQSVHWCSVGSEHFWEKKITKQLKLLFTVVPTIRILLMINRSAAGYQSKTVRFLQVAFDTTGEAFLAGDHHGNIYVFDISRNRYVKFKQTKK